MNPGDQMWRWVWTGGESYGNVEVTVVRVNRRSVTVRYLDGHIVRVQPGELSHAEQDWGLTRPTVGGV
jgi:hypothetical protein